MSEIWMVYSTFPGQEEAVFAARSLVERRLIACANIINAVTSVYRWQSGIQQEQEVAMVAKTSQAQVAAAMEALKNLHPYQIPCIVAYPAGQSSPPFRAWVESETA